MFEGDFLAPWAKATASSFFFHIQKVVFDSASFEPAIGWWRLCPWNSCLSQSFCLFSERGETVATLVLVIPRLTLLFAGKSCSESSRASPCLIELLGCLYESLIAFGSRLFWVCLGSRKNECRTLAGTPGSTYTFVMRWHPRVFLVCIRHHWFMT